ncbi:hypothetical protein PRS30_29900, partial [Klebsiella pneumoniae]|nr:hypothetical protein [Klebsiella pneumoniae]
TAATLEGQFWYLRSVKASYLRKKELVALDSGKRTTVGSGGFLFAGHEITTQQKGSQEVPCCIATILEICPIRGIIR